MFMHLFSRATDPVDDNSYYQDDLVAHLQDLKHSERAAYYQGLDQDSQHRSHYREQAKPQSQEGSGEQLHDKFPQRNLQRDRDKLAKLQWGRFRIPRIRIPRIRHPRKPRIPIPRVRIHHPWIRRVRRSCRRFG